MNIIETNLNFGDLTKRGKTDSIILHNSGVTALQDVNIIHNYHLSKGWAGIGYNFYVRKDGNIYRGRPEWAVGAHATGYNSVSIGICFEGNFDVEQMTDEQVKAGKELVAYLKNKYDINKVLRHSDVGLTACPGKNFRYEEIANGSVTFYGFKDFVKELQAAIGAKVDGIVGNETLSKTPILAKNINRKHAAVKVVQKYLTYLGYVAIGEIDGIAGNKFDEAVKQYQRNNELVTDGIIGKNTWKKLLT